ncbi:hypothetical protein AJ80_03050 [Polytolypa hystricis UAMH7299]|uniref:Uncharacterized protein n=1 Tax=Polytolypa hystricis (strain UAMH7299) TaxID=1447883 RepID=A0A2B7YLW9_POLH7|nr:hypothetical protein AJ80_03050 [Polytolypa hystricis UAMH7299]
MKNNHIDLYFSPREKRLVGYLTLLWGSTRFGKTLYDILRRTLSRRKMRRRALRPSSRPRAEQATRSGENDSANAAILGNNNHLITNFRFPTAQPNDIICSLTYLPPPVRKRNAEPNIVFQQCVNPIWKTQSPTAPPAIADSPSSSRRTVPRSPNPQPAAAPKHKTE